MPDATSETTRAHGELESGDGTRIAFRRWRPDRPTGRVLIVHGLGDHSGRFESFGRRLSGGGLEALALDLRGHGLSAGRRGHAERFERLLGDLELLRREAESVGGALPTVLFGHSLGGLVVLRYLQGGAPEEVRGAVAAAPFLSLRMEPPAWKLAIGRLADRWMPALTLPSGAESELVLRRPEAREERRSDPHVHDRISARLWGEMQRAAASVRAGVGDLAAPVLLQVAGDDRLVSSAAAVALAEDGPGAVRVRRYPDAYHDLLHDPVAERVAADAVAWIRERVTEGGTRGPEPAYRLHPDGSTRAPRHGDAKPRAVHDHPGAPAMDEKEPASGANEAAADESADADPEPVEGAQEAEERRDAEEAPGLELEDLRERHLRLAAEYDNYRKRTRREMSEARERAQAQLTGRLLDALDDLDRFVESSEEEADVESLHEGMEMVRRKLWKELSAAGLERMEAEGERFDPERHDALLTTPVEDPEEDGLVSRELIAGYRFGDRVLRPARVEVKRYVGEGEGGDDVDEGAEDRTD